VFVVSIVFIGLIGLPYVVLGIFSPVLPDNEYEMIHTQQEPKEEWS